MVDINNVLDCFPFKSFRKYQKETILKIAEAFDKGKKFVIVEAPTGCHAKGSPILMYDGTIKNADDVKVGEVLMGKDSTPRNVLELHNGKQTMYKISPISGEPFVVNEYHILALQRTNIVSEKRLKVKRLSDTKGGKEFCNITVKDYLKQSKTFKHAYKLYRAPVDFPKKSLLMPPYIMGIWLGDGTEGKPEITKPDIEVIQAWKDYGTSLGLNTTEGENDAHCPQISLVNKKGERNPINEILRYYGIFKNKRIPFDFKTSDRQDRLELLAGLLDTDGYYCSGFEIIQKRKDLAEDIVYLSLSLGFFASISEKWIKLPNWDEPRLYYRICISGNLEQIPTKIKRKQATARKQKKEVSRTGFKVEPVGEAEYYGFTVDKDNLYLMGNFIVTHNSGKSSYAMTVARYFMRYLNQRSFILTSHKVLQDQYDNEFGKDGDFVVVKGRNNFNCPLCGNSDADNCDKATVLTVTPQTIKKHKLGHMAKEFTGKHISELCSFLTRSKSETAQQSQHSCEYILQRDRGIQSPITLHNYFSYLTYMNYTTLFDNRDLLICDEAHSIESQLMSFVEVKLTAKECQEKCDIDKIPEYSDLYDYKEFIETLRDTLDKHIKKLRNDVNALNEDEADVAALDRDIDSCIDGLEMVTDRADAVRIVERLRDNIDNSDIDSCILATLHEFKDERIDVQQVVANISALKKAPSGLNAAYRDEAKSELQEKVNKANHIFEKLCKILICIDSKSDSWTFALEKSLEKDIMGNREVRAITFKPITVEKEVQEFLFQYSNKILLMSATIGDMDIFCRYLGIDRKDAEFIRLSSTFPVENRPIYLLRKAPKLNYKNIDEMLPSIVTLIERIALKHGNQKGVVHTNSYKIQDAIKNRLDGVSRFLFPVTAKEKNRALEQHFESSEPTVLVSPAFSQGLDLRDTLCRWQVICKTPYPSLADKQIKLRCDMDRAWYANQTALSVIQAYGRGVRSDNDWCITYVIDTAFLAFLTTNMELFPDWVIAAVKAIDDENAVSEVK